MESVGKIVLTVDSAGNLVDDAGAIIYSGFSTGGYRYSEKEESVDIAGLVSLGVTADELLKLKAAKVI